MKSQNWHILSFLSRLLKMTNIAIVLLVVSQLPAYSGNLFEDVAGGIGSVFGSFIGRASEPALEKAREEAMKVLSMLDTIAEKRIDQADKISEKRMAELREIILILDRSAKDNVQNVNSALESSIRQLESLRKNTIKDIDHVFDQIYGVMNEAECIAIGRQLETELAAHRIVSDILNQLIGILKKPDERDRNISASQYYRETKRLLLSKLTEQSKIEDILYVYSDLQLISKGMRCLHRNLEAQTLYTEEMLEFERKYRLWNSL